MTETTLFTKIRDREIPSDIVYEDEETMAFLDVNAVARGNRFLAMGELSLLPAVRQAPADAILVAGGTSCRHQIADGSGRQAHHLAVVLRDALAEQGRPEP